MTQAFGCIDGSHIQLNAHKRTHKIFSARDNSIHYVYRLCVTIKFPF